MILGEAHDYELLLASGAYSLAQHGRRATFQAALATGGTPKIYAVAKDYQLIYVGVATQAMSGRLRDGFRSARKNGYAGYKWKDLEVTLRLSVWTPTLRDTNATFQDLETVEAEVAFLCRQRTDQWPAYQHEIHFHMSGDPHRAAAVQIYEHVVSKASRPPR